MKGRRIISLGITCILAVSVIFSGCGKKEKKVKLENGEISENSVVMMVGEAPVRFHEIQAYCYFLKCQYEKSFGEELWSYPLEGKETIGDRAKQEIVNMITQLRVINVAAKEWGVELTSDEKDEAMRLAEELMDNASAQDIEEYSLNVQEITEIYQENALANKMFYISTDKADTNVSDEEARQASIQCIQVMTKGIDRNGVKLSLDDIAREEAYQRALTLRDAVVKTENFLEFAQKNSDTEENQWLIGRDTQTLEAVVVKEALDLEEGEISEVIEGEKGYYILYCVNPQDETATYARKEEIIANRQRELFMENYAGWLKDKKVDINQNFWNEFSI